MDSVDPTPEQLETSKKIMDIAGRQPLSYDGQQERDAAALLARRDAALLEGKEREIAQLKWDVDNIHRVVDQYKERAVESTRIERESIKLREQAEAKLAQAEKERDDWSHRAGEELTTLRAKLSPAQPEQTRKP